MTKGTETPAQRHAACVEIAEWLAPELARSLRWLASHPRSGAVLVVEGFVREGELVLVADIPGNPGRQESRSRPPFGMSVRRGLLSFALSLAPNGRKARRSVEAPASTRPSPPSRARAGAATA
jgi:hypothetical protein